MRRRPNRPMLLLVAAGLLSAACGGDANPATTTMPDPDAVTSTSTTAPPATTTSTTTTTTTLPPAGPPLIREGDKNETVAAFQWLLNCTGHGDLTVDGNYGPATRAAVVAAQNALGRAADGTPDEETFAELSRRCPQSRRLTPDGSTTVVGNAGPGDPEVFAVALVFDSIVTVTLTPADGAEVLVRPTGAVPLEPEPEGGIWQIATTGDYEIMVIAEDGPVTFTMTVAVASGAAGEADWIIATRSVTYRGTRLALGDDAQTVIDKVIEFLGHGVRGTYEEFDTGWYTIDDPPNGLRGLSIGGFAFLFFGPDPTNPDRPETLARIRFEGPNPDAAGNPRPANYAATVSGITVGHTLADLQAAYGSRVRAGKNDREHYYRIAEGGGELCFYFGAEAPKEGSVILEIATQCRG